MVLNGIRESVKSKITGKTWEISGLHGNSWIPVFETKGKKPTLSNIVMTAEYRKYRLLCVESGRKEWEVTNFEFEKSENKTSLRKGQDVSNQKSTELEQIEKIMTFLKTMKGDIKDELLENLKITEKQNPVKMIIEQFKDIKNLKEQFGVDLEKGTGTESKGSLETIVKLLELVSNPQVQQSIAQFIPGQGPGQQPREITREQARAIHDQYEKDQHVPKPPPRTEPKPKGGEDD